MAGTRCIVANETLWDVDLAGPGTTTTWDGDTTVWDLLPEALKIDGLAKVLPSRWLAAVNPSRWLGKVLRS